MSEKAHVVKKMKLHLHKRSAEQTYLPMNRERFKITRIAGIEQQSVLKSKPQQQFQAQYFFHFENETLHLSKLRVKLYKGSYFTIFVQCAHPKCIKTVERIFIL